MSLRRCNLRGPKCRAQAPTCRQRGQGTRRYHTQHVAREAVASLRLPSAGRTRLYRTRLVLISCCRLPVRDCVLRRAAGTPHVEPRCSLPSERDQHAPCVSPVLCVARCVISSVARSRARFTQPHPSSGSVSWSADTERFQSTGDDCRLRLGRTVVTSSMHACRLGSCQRSCAQRGPLTT